MRFPSSRRRGLRGGLGERDCDMKEILRYIAGYIVGTTIFGISIPLGLIELSKIDSSLGIGLTGSRIVRLAISGPLFILGVIFMIWSNVALITIGKGGPTEAFNVAISPKTKKLVIVGPYKYTRNPMVFGAFSIYTAVGIFLNSPFCLAAILLFIFMARYCLKHSEEKRLLKDFGDEYKEYQKHVSMILPIKK
jgi:protein-S-isoprenylcysteine O-methyltransferase Ste14